MIYFIQEDEPGRDRIKIGYTINVYRRIENLESCSPSKLKCVLYFPGCRKTEKYYHEKFQNMRIRSEWFRFEGELKSFVLSNMGRSWSSKENIEFETEGS